MLNESGFRSDVIEKQLAHSEKDAVRASYNRAEYMAERQKMMQHWADFIDDIRTLETPISATPMAKNAL